MRGIGSGAVALVMGLSVAAPLQAATATASALARTQIVAESLPDGVSLDYFGAIFEVDGFGTGPSASFLAGSDIDDDGVLRLEATAGASAGPAFGVATAFSYLDGLISLSNATGAVQTVVLSVLYAVQATATLAGPASGSADAQAEISIFDGAVVPFSKLVERGLFTGHGTLSMDGSFALRILLAPGEQGRDLVVVVDAFAQARATSVATVIPLPAALTLLLTAVAGLGWVGAMRRRRKGA